MKIFIQLFVACLLPISLVAQMRAPENVLIGFYGKVVDQNETPVTGATVNFDIVTSHMSEDRTESTPAVLQTDQGGNFALIGVTGYGLDKISVQKEGYELSPKTQRDYVFGLKPDYKPNTNSPVIFRMWKEAGKEPLVGSAWHGKVACDGTTNRYDLIIGHPSADGGLEIVCSRIPLTLPPASSKPFGYKFQITVGSGGIQQTEDEFTYLAPENGYMPNLTFEQKAGDPKWNGRLPQEFYIKTADGHYGTLFVEWGDGFRQPPLPLK